MRDGFVRARIQWLTPEEGGRSNPIGPKSYASTLSFTHDPHDQWSFFIENYGVPDPITHTHYVELTLLVREMIPELLKSGRREFSAYEGSRLVGRGEILG